MDPIMQIKRVAHHSFLMLCHGGITRRLSHEDPLKVYMIVITYPSGRKQTDLIDIGAAS